MEKWSTSLGTSQRNEDKGRGQEQLLEGRRIPSSLVARIEIGKFSVEGLISLSVCGVKKIFLILAFLIL